jgi:acetyl esterase/lipase
MPSRHTLLIFLALAAGVLGAELVPASAEAPQEPRAYVYREVEGQKLNAYVFLPPNQDVEKKISAVLLFHGGAWIMGSAQWTFEAARHFADLGLVAVAVDYRLSKGQITPIEAVDDTRAAFRWVRRHAAEFHIDTRRVAGYGVSAGGQLVAVAVTPLERAEQFRERVIRTGGICELHVYPGVGHLLTRNVANQLSDFDPDPKFRADGLAQIERFLRERGYLPVK